MSAIVNLPAMTVEGAERLSERISAAMKELQDSSKISQAMRRDHPVEYAAVMAERSPIPQAPIETPHYSTSSSVVYFVQAGDDGPVKIGYASDFLKRLSALQTGCPDQLRVLGMFPGGPSEEKELHTRLNMHRMRGEWFAPSDTVLSAIAEASK
jgi:hypothetical protein